jgi:hypothetical protein
MANFERKGLRKKFGGIKVLEKIGESYIMKN